MELAIRYNNIKPCHIHFDFVQRNKVIDNGHFIKLNYHNEENEITLYKINIASPILCMNNHIKTLYNNKHKCNINYLYIENNKTNSDFISFVKKADNYFNKKTKEYCCKNGLNITNHTYSGMLKNNEINGILFRMPINSKDIYKKDKKEMKEVSDNKYQIILRWNGIWISNNQYGLNYKILMVVES
jgi:hypothetical protein